MSTYWKDGLLFHGYWYGEKGNEDEQVIPSENAALHTVVHYVASKFHNKFSVKLLPFLQNLKQLYRGGRWRPCVDESFKDEGFSHDNMTAIVSLGLLFDAPEFAQAGVKNLLRQPYLHPRDVFFYFYAAGLTLFSVPALAFTIYAALFGSVSGKQLAWLKFICNAGNSRLWALSFYLVSKRVNWYYDMAAKYYTFGDHPCRSVFFNIYGGKP